MESKKKIKIKDANGKEVSVGSKVHYIVSDANDNSQTRYVIEGIKKNMVTIRQFYGRKGKTIDVPASHISLHPFAFDCDKTVIHENSVCARVDDNGVEMLDENTFNPIELKVERIIPNQQDSVVIANMDKRMNPKNLRVLSD